MLFTRRLGSTAISVQTTPVGYVSVVDNRSGGPPIAHWRCGDAAPTGAPPPPSTPSVAQANCFPESSSTTVEVGGSVANIVAAANNAAPGTHILVQPGTYSGGSGEITAVGTSGAGKIVIRPRDGFGTVTFSGISLDLSGSHIVWTGFRHVNGPRIRLAGGSFNRITRCYFAEITRFIHDVPRGFDHRVDHNEYTTYIAGGNRGVMNFDANHIRDGIVGRIRFDYNYIHDITPSSGDGGCEIIRTGSTSQAIGTAWTVANPFIWIENNLLVNIDMPSEGEVFSIKSPGNIIRGNTLINVMMYISLRTTHDTEVSRNWIEGGTNLAINGHGRNNRYIANRILDGGELRIGAGDATTQDQIDALPTSTVFYAASENCQVVDNIVEEDGQIRVGGFWSTWGSLPNHEPARNNNLWGNVSLEGGDAHVLVSGGPTRHTGTTFLDPGIDYDPAVKLTTADVGIEADDPLCSASDGGGGGTPGTLTDRIGTRHATVSGSPTYAVPGLPANSDGAINLAGAGTAEVEHDSGLELAALSLSFWFRLNSLEPDKTHALISKDESGNNDGDFAAYVTGQGELRVYFQDPSTTHLFTAQVFPGIDYNVVVRADNSGFDAFLNAQTMGVKETGYTDAWTNNAQKLRFGTVPAAPDPADIILDEVALYDYALTFDDVLALAQRSAAPPVALNKAFSVPENTLTLLDVVAGATYVGEKADLTVEVWDGSAWASMAATSRGTAVVNANNDIEFTADVVTQDQPDSFLYRITDSVGTSAPATVSLIINDSAAAPANLFVATNGNDNNPGTEAQPFRTIQKALNVAGPGDTIQVAPGSYSGADWPNSGTSGNPITLRAQFPAASPSTSPSQYTRITGNINVEHLRIQGRSHVVVDGFYFNGGSSRAITLAGNSNTSLSVGGIIQNCRIEQPFDRDYSNGVLLLRTDGAIVRHNVFLDLGPDVTNPVMDYAIICNTFNRNAQILGNYFAGRFHQCISLKESCDNFRVAFNTFDGSRLTSIFIGQQDDGFQDNIDQTCMNNVFEFNHFRNMRVGSQNYPLNVVTQIKNSGNTVFRYNLIENAAVGILHQITAHTGAYYSGGGGKFSAGDKPINDEYYGNVFINCTVAIRALGQGYTDTVKVWNNTIYQCSRSYDADGYPTSRTDAWIETYAPPNVQFYNNNVSGSGAPTGTLNTTTWRNNNWHNSGGTRHSSDMAVNPQFVGTPTIHQPTAPSVTFEPDFTKVSLLKLQSGSPLLNAGLDVGLVSNPPPDIGHNEFTYLTSDTGSGDPGDPGEVGEFITTPEAHGWSDAKTVSQNTAAFNAAIAEAAANAGSSSTGRGVVELVQNKTYTVATTNGSINNQNAALPLLSNVEIRTVGAPTRLSGNQATIQFASWAGKSGVHNQAIFRIDSGVNNVLIGWLTLHGNKNTLDDETDVNYNQGQDGGIHNVVIYGGTNITFREVFSTHALNDALYLRTSSDPNLLIEDCTFTRCRRQGISITRLGTSGAGIDQMVCRRLLVSDIGDFPGDIGGQRPGAGIDIEPNADSEEVHGLTIDDCDFEGVLGSVWHHGVNDGGQSDGAGVLGQSRADMSKLRIINSRFTECRRGLVLKASGSTPVHSDVLIEDVVITDSTNDDNIRLESAGADGGTLVDWSIINPKIGSAGNGAVTVEATLAPSGHSVDIWKGDFNATLSNPGGLTTFTLHDGFPNGNGGGNGGEPGEIEDGGGQTYTSNTAAQNHDITVNLGAGTNRKIAVILAKDLANRPINSATFDLGGDDEAAMTAVDAEDISGTTIRGFWYDIPDNVDAGNKVIRVAIGNGNVTATGHVQWWKNVASGAPITNSTSDTDATGLSYTLSDLPEGAVVFSGIVRSNQAGSFSPDDGQQELHEDTVSSNDHRAAYGHLVGASAGTFNVTWDDSASAPRVASLAMAWGPATS